MVASRYLADKLLDHPGMFLSTLNRKVIGMSKTQQHEQAPIIIEANNGAQVTVEVKIIRRDLDHDSVRWWADMIAGRPMQTVTARRK